MTEISVTVPVYNVEKYLRRCLDSILEQTFKLDYEIICVDDGSNDNSSKILFEYSLKNPGKFKIIRQENKGLSEARNTALKYVKGKYTMFVDSDDFIANNALELLYDFAQAHNSEVVVFDYFQGREGQKNFQRYHYENIIRKYADAQFNVETSDAALLGSISVATWSKFYLTEFIEKIKFEPGLNNQDVCHWAEVFVKAKKINYLPVPLYFYVSYRDNAISMNKGKKVFDVFKSFKKAKKILIDSGYFEKFQDVHYLLFASYLVVDLKKIVPELRKEFVEKIKKYDMNINYDKILNGDYSKTQKEDIYLMKLIKENDYKTVEDFCYEKRIWKKDIA